VPLPDAGINQVALSPSSFTNGSGVALSDWDDIKLLGLLPGNKLDSGESVWAGDTPTFSDLHWEGASYPGDTTTVTNGVPFVWLQSYGLEPTDASALTDSDGDGLLNWEEFYAGTNPTNDASGLWLINLRSSGTQIVFDWPSVSGKIYTVRFKTNLLDSAWNTVESNVLSTEPLNTSSVQVDNDTGFIRIEVERP
ncbi:hypothetical protein P4B35_23845, partial [Pontiellaceae bacterium B12227]|nr:hypothetical protein [Pontiellaceae bacterium B12227]